VPSFVIHQNLIQETDFEKHAKWKTNLRGKFNGQLIFTFQT
jgi:hypothetical protein